MKEDSFVRLNKYIASCGICSRRKADQLIEDGRVKVNNKKIYELGTKIDPSVDAVSVNGEQIDNKLIQPIYIVLNKPRGYVSTVSDPEGRNTVMDLVKDISERIYPVGRLDYLSEGLMILTNDGELANSVLHPKYNVQKVYEVKVFGIVTPKLLSQLRKERYFPEGKVKPKSVRVVKQLENKTWLEFVLSEGRNREIRRICEEEGVVIDKLKRVAIENLSVEGISPGTYRFITKKKLLSKLNIKIGGEIIHTERAKFRSNKNSVKFKGKFLKENNKANNEFYEIFKKDQYYDSIKKISAKKAESKKLKEKPKKEVPEINYRSE